jgi:hypothetical protein
MIKSTNRSVVKHFLPTASRAIMPALNNPRHESYAQERFRGLSPSAAYLRSGYRNRSGASKLARHPEVVARIAELGQEAAAHVQYDRDYVVQKLIAIIEAPPDSAGAGNPLCETRMVGSTPHYFFPAKLDAIGALCKMMGWNQTGPPTPPPPDKFVQLMEFIRKRK